MSNRVPCSVRSLGLRGWQLTQDGVGVRRWLSGCLKSLGIGLALFGVLLMDARASGVVINEIFYHAPDDLESLEFIELWNSGEEAADIGGWKLTGGVTLEIPQGTRIAAGEYWVACRDAALFERIYGAKPQSVFEKSLSNKGERIRLRDQAGNDVEVVEYGDRHPWPKSADGKSASLERVHPDAPAESPHSWAPSDLSASFLNQPSGTPGRPNTQSVDAVPPAILGVEEGRRILEPGESIRVETEVSRDDLEVLLNYQIVQPGSVSDPAAIPMSRTASGRFAGELPGQEAGRIIRYWVTAANADGSEARMPRTNDLRPAYSSYVRSASAVGQIPVVDFIGVGKEAFDRFNAYRTEHVRRFGRGGYGGYRPDRERDPSEMLRRALTERLRNIRLVDSFAALTLSQEVASEHWRPLTEAFQEANRSIESLSLKLRSESDLNAFRDGLDSKLSAITDTLITECSAILGDGQSEGVLSKMRETVTSSRSAFGRRPADILRVFYNVEEIWYRAMVRSELDQSKRIEIRDFCVTALAERTRLVKQIEQEGADFRSILNEARNAREEIEEKIASFSAESGDDRRTQQARRSGPSFGSRGPDPRSRMRFGGSSRSVPVPPQGESALVYREPGSEEIQFFDFVNILPRKSGFKVRLHKDQPLNGSTTLNVLYERGDASTINEIMAYPMYRRAGNVTVDSGAWRVLMNGSVAGYHVWFEQPNGNFFERNGVNAKGDLYKVIWQRSNRPSELTPESIRPRRTDIVSRYEKMTRPHSGYEDLIVMVEALERSREDESAMWKVIEEHFEVDQVINYYAVNLLLSHWDGFFNNYFLYYDKNGSGKWSILPWDQDSTWSLRGGTPDSLAKMPLNYGGEGARPSGVSDEQAARTRNSEGGRRGFGGFSFFGGGRGFGWWRDGDTISKALIGNPTFFARYLKRIEELVTTVFSPEAGERYIRELETKLKPEIQLRATTHGVDSASRHQQFSEAVATMREHLEKRTAFIRSELN